MMQTLVRATKRTTGFCDSATNCLAGFWQSTRSRVHGKSHGRAGLEPITPLGSATGSRRSAMKHGPVTGQVTVRQGGAAAWNQRIR